MSNADKRIYIDSETCGLHSMMVLFQYAVEEDPITLYDVWKRPVGETLDLLEWVATHTVVGFNLVFDWFHVAKIYTIWSLLPRDWIPEEHIAEIAELEAKGQDGPCIKPANALDLLLHSRKGPYQSLMARSDIRIRRVPTALAYALAEELEERVAIDGIYFARSHDPDAPRWQVFDVKRRDGEIDPNFKDVVLRFNPAGGLKFLAEHALGYVPKYHYQDVEPPRDWYPKELGFAPTAKAVSRAELNWEVYKTENGKRRVIGYAWPAQISKFIEHWATREDAREYASDDIKYTRELCHHFGDPTPGDDDSVLACMVPVIRWHGFKIDRKGMRALLTKAQAVVENAPVNINKPGEVRAYIGECLDDMEKVVLESSTKKANIQAIAKWEVDADEPCSKCDGEGKHAQGFCHRCEGTGTLHAIGEITDDHGNHPAALRAHEILAVKIAGKEVELYRKLIKAKKFHASFNVIGTLSTRMSGGDGLNAQGIKATKEVRCMFPLAWDKPKPANLQRTMRDILGLSDADFEKHWAMVEAQLGDGAEYELCGGDFDSFEVTLADAVYKDPDLRKALTTKVPCHKCDAVGKVKGCKSCKGKGKVERKPCEDCNGKGRHAVTDLNEAGLKECGECDGTGKTTKKIHALFAMCLFPGKTYEDIVASAGTQNDMYSKGKQGVFAMIYGGDFNTLVRNLGVTVEVAKAAFDTWNKWFPQSAKARERTFRAFCSMKQPGGTGSAVIWDDPAAYVESFLGFRRYFNLENTITKALFDLSRKLPKAWRDCKVKVVRRDRVQFAGGAVSSALYGAAFQIQAGNQRAAANHEIQRPGGQITKAVQRAIWDLQPAGVHQLYVAPMNVHDELMTVSHPDYIMPVAEKVQGRVDYYRDRPEGPVPLIGMTWCLAMTNWAEKKGSATTMKMRSPLMEAVAA
jgi:hypothetical protein